MIEAADIFASEALEEKDDDVLSREARITRKSRFSRETRLMNRGEDGFELCFALVIARVVIAVLADGTEEREGGVQDERRIVRTVDELIGGADLDRTVVPEASAHACPTEEGCDE